MNVDNFQPTIEQLNAMIYGLDTLTDFEESESLIIALINVRDRCGESCVKIS